MIYIAVLNNLIVNGSARFLNKLYANDVDIGSNLSIAGNIEAEGTLDIGNNVYLNNKLALRGFDTYLRVNDTGTFTNGVYFGTSRVRTDNSFEVGNGSSLSFNATMSAITLNKPTTINSTLSVPNVATITTGNIATVNSSKITATNIDVKGKIHAVEFDLENIMDLGGSFIVAPTLIVPSSSEEGTKTLKVKRGSNTTSMIFTIQDPSIIAGGIAGFAWAANYKVKVSGLVNNTVLGTCTGYINYTNIGSNTIQITLINADAEIVSAIAPTTDTSYETYKLNIMLYNTDTTSVSSETKPLGIYLQHYELTNNPIINVWNGQTTTPKVRIGYLEGITYKNTALGTNADNSWGLYSDNVFLEGQIIANGGTIGGYDIGTNNLKKGSTRNADGSFWLTPSGENTTMSNLNSTALNWAMTVGQNFGVTTGGGVYATSGKIGKWNISANDLYNGTIGSTTSALVSIGTSSNADIGGSGASSHTWSFTAGSKFGVTNTGALYCNDIHATSGTIGSYTLNANYLQSTDGTTGMSVADNSSTANWAFWAGGASTSAAKFRVTHDGILYATSAEITGDIAANTLHVGASSNPNHLIYENNTIDLSTDWLKFDSSTETVSIGKKTSSTSLQTKIKSDSFWITGDDSTTIVYMGNESRPITDTFVSDGETLTYTLSEAVASGGTVWPSSVIVSGVVGRQLTVTSASLPEAGDYFTYTYTPANIQTYYSMGYRGGNENKGNYSFAQGCATEAPGFASHAEGEETAARGECSHSEGMFSVAQGSCSHAQGLETRASGEASHSEGSYTIAAGKSSHAQGDSCWADGEASFATGIQSAAEGEASNALGEGAYARKKAQTVIGTWCDEDTSTTTTHPSGNTDYGTYAFIIGNGQSYSSPHSNALTVDWRGNLICNNHQVGIVAQGYQTVDGIPWRYRRWSNNFLELWTSVTITPTAANRATSKTINFPFYMTTSYFNGQASLSGIPEITTCHIGLTPQTANNKYFAVNLNIYASNTTQRGVYIYLSGNYTT